MSNSISSAGGGLGISSSLPTGSEMSSFSSTLKGASTEKLLEGLGKQGMESWQKDAILKELENRAEKSQKSDESGGAQGSGGSGGGGDDDEIKKLLAKLKKGTISPEEEQKLAGALGVDTKTLDAAKGGGDSASSSSDSDIQGG